MNIALRAVVGLLALTCPFADGTKLTAPIEKLHAPLPWTQLRHRCRSGRSAGSRPSAPSA